MASSKKPPSDPIAHVASVIRQRVYPGQRLTLGLSGGLDSVALLDILVQLSAPLQFQLDAIHVNHHLNPNASGWADFCARLCQDYAIPLKIADVTIEPDGHSLEASARNARHAVLARSDADFIVLAHHLDDQAETLLLQLMRGSGVAGTSAMGEYRHRLLRPLLELPRSTLERYANQRRLTWVEDESNLDTRFDRNFLRHRLLPVMKERYPAYRETLYRASRNFAESALLLEELAQLDAMSAIRDGKLSTSALESLSFPRAKNLLRHYLRQHGIAAPSAIHLEEMLRQLLDARQDARIRIPLGAFELRRFLGQAWIIPVQLPPAHGFCQPWRGEHNLQLPPLGGELEFCMVHGQGISLARLQRENVTVRIRHGGEHLQPDCKRPRRSLKNLFQEAGTPPWSRRILPLIYSGDRLAAVTGIGIDCEYQAGADEPGILLEWRV